ncbi:DUF2147 domain-containing protein [Aquabacterium soli]|uniref:DUF2147 domain-containing protein n=1 Tax=Aquabacterium soli TaxID=2493092 RepID=A0A3R8T9P7_9BURK|nr:DUF2147 domain-containing protein [Aquabacterium soli]RRS02719.1 DUF2147 domain-containing protein [Aquabacterium soli]
MTIHLAPSPHWAPPRREVLRVCAALCVTVLIGGTAIAQAVPPPSSPAGRWITASGNVEVDVARCGPAWCGTITRVLSQQSMSRPGEVMTPADTRPALGMTILKDFLPEDEAAEGSPVARWQGHIYNRENGKTYRCLMSLDATGGLVLRPFVGLPIFGKTQVWRRLDATSAATPVTSREGQP